MSIPGEYYNPASDFFLRYGWIKERPTGFGTEAHIQEIIRQAYDLIWKILQRHVTVAEPNNFLDTVKRIELEIALRIYEHELALAEKRQINSNMEIYLTTEIADRLRKIEDDVIVINVGPPASEGLN